MVGVADYQLLIGDVREQLQSLPAASVDCLVTSPPYFNLRNYGTPPVIWGGESTCDHQFEIRRWYSERTSSRSSSEAFSEAGDANADRVKTARWREDAFCRNCGAWKGELGQEPNPELYIQHLVEVFTVARCVLKPTATLWINLGDSYSRGTRVKNPADAMRGLNPGSKHISVTEAASYGGTGMADRPAKNLLLIPSRFALAMQDAGFILRNDIIWHSPNPMPESVRDRFTQSYEHILLFSLQEKYYFDADAVREPVTEESVARIQRGRSLTHKWAHGGPGNQTDLSHALHPNGRNKRDVWVIPTSGYSGAHFATFPEALVETPILAGSPEGGTVLDPFGGSGTTLAVANRLGRHAIGVELNEDYVPLIRERCARTGFIFAGS